MEKSERMNFTNTDQDDEGGIEMEMIGRSWRRDERRGEMMQAGRALPPPGCGATWGAANH
jgi:hypothetical protein